MRRWQDEESVLLNGELIVDEEKVFIDSFAKFHFDKGNYIKKIESLYDNLKFWKSFTCEL